MTPAHKFFNDTFPLEQRHGHHTQSSNTASAAMHNPLVRRGDTTG